MLYSYLKIALRQARRNPGTTLINVAGLSIGITICFLIGLFVWDEWQFDKHHPDQERIYRITAERGGEDGSAHWAGTAPAFGPALNADFPEVESTLRLFQIRQKLLFNRGESSFLEERGFFVENSVFDFFELPFHYGEAEGALEQPNTIVLTMPLARKYFGSENPVGQTIEINDNEVTVTGVLAPQSPHFHLDFDYLLSFENLLNQVSEERIASWVWQDFYNYIKLYPATDLDAFSAKLSRYVEDHAHPQTQEHGFYYYPILQPLTDIHLHSGHITNDAAVRGNSRYVNSLALVGIFLLLIACINFINMSTAKAAKRANEVGVRKATGAQRGQLSKQFLIETTIIVSLAMLIALPLTLVTLPLLNNFTDKTLVFPILTNPLLLLLIIGLTLLLGLLAGSYPAFVLSGFRPAAVLKGGLIKPSSHVNWLRKALVTTQFSLSILLISCVLIIFRQVNFLTETDLGFAKEQLLHFPMRGNMFSNIENTKEEFLKVSGVTSASACFGIPGDIVSGDNIIVPGENRRNLPARIFNVDHDYIETMGMKLLAGRDFSKAIATDATEAFIINETAMHNLDIASTPEEAIGKRLEWKMWTDRDTIKKGTIIGVIRDFHYNSMHENVETTVLQIYPDSYWKMVLRLNSRDLSESIAAIEQQWDAFNTGFPLDYQFVDAGFQAMYESEQKLSSLLLIFTILAVFIACIGAFGLAVHATEQKRKEIGIRKVLGASIISIVTLMSGDFLKLVITALLIATPIAWLLMNAWLEDFAYRIQIEWWMFATAGLLAMVIAFLTVGSQSFRAALTDPVKSLRNE